MVGVSFFFSFFFVAGIIFPTSAIPKDPPCKYAHPSQISSEHCLVADRGVAFLDSCNRQKNGTNNLHFRLRTACGHCYPSRCWISPLEKARKVSFNQSSLDPENIRSTLLYPHSVVLSLIPKCQTFFFSHPSKFCTQHPIIMT